MKGPNIHGQHYSLDLYIRTKNTAQETKLMILYVTAARKMIALLMENVLH